ncbi:MAG: 3-oxoacyl-[acyl-carrier protein] reductase [Cytophagales bacterium]|jgi:short-subunit dehydrogenase|nr:SDR family oxidoreductase [Bacteroidota bacterium]MBS1982162.1 SDR family oxidoreductase [Bacteroidota bacterium]WHZ09550.1 MAG: 3-oxoacyl-[acyl-carrier protein] reductase [Cytophagales bacterium]
MAFALITGASGGIGLSMAHELAKRKIDLLLVARSEEKLLTLQKDLSNKFGVRVEYLCKDLSAEQSAAAIKEWIDKNNFSVHILINNAGYGVWGAVENTAVEKLTNMMQLNMLTLVELCHAFIPELKKHTQSYILNVASTAAYQAVPTLSTYAATKAFVILFTRGLRRELKKSSVSVTCVSPGATSTSFIDRAGMSAMKDRAEKFSMTPEAVAKIAIDGMFHKKAEVITGFANWLSAQLTYWVPKSIPEKIAESLYRTKP